MADGRNDLTKEQRRDLMSKLAEIGGGLFSPEDDIISQGHQLILPEGMTMSRAVKFLAERIEADEKQVRYVRDFRFRPWDGAVCTWRALKRIFGMVGMRDRMGFFGPEPPSLIDIPVGPGETEQVPWGDMVLPAFENTVISTGADVDPELGILFKLTIMAPRKYRAQVEGIFAIVEEELASRSIYRGKAFDGQEKPEFLDLSGVDESKVIYSDATMIQLNANVWSVLEHREALREAGISRKRSALLYGPYGTGKTLGGFLTAQKAIANGWTFLYARPGRDKVEDVVQTARLYQPAVVFVEDLDTVADADNSADTTSKLLDLFDGITAKGTELMIVLTTNHPDKIHKGMLRPGRLDAVIEIGHLDEQGVTRLIQNTLPAGSVADDVDWGSVFVANEGFLPAYVKEAADRAYRYALSRTGEPEGIVLTTEDLVFAAEGLRPQLDLMNGAQEHPKVNQLSEGVREVVHEVVVGSMVEHFGFQDEKARG